MIDTTSQTGVYRITNTVNGKIYIGSTGTSFKQRWRRGYNPYLTLAIKKHGLQNFTFEALLVCEPADCLKYEQIYLDNYKPWVSTGAGYNFCQVAGSRRG